jgi:hypothetical protein
MARAKQSSVFLSSVLPLAHRDELERIVFFNPQQSRFIDPVLAAVNSYGVPAIVEERDRLRLSVPAFPSIQTLYALDGPRQTAELVGVTAFVRETADSMLLLHVAVHQDYSTDGPKADEWLPVRLVSAVRDICRRTRGITWLRVLYPKHARYPLGPASIDKKD